MPLAQAPGEVLSERAHSVLAAACSMTTEDRPGAVLAGQGEDTGLCSAGSPGVDTPGAHRVSDPLSVFPA